MQILMCYYSFMLDVEESTISPPVQEQKAKQEIANHKLASLEEPLFEILIQLKPFIQRGAFSLIIGEDTSGRIPTLILEKVINKIYSDKGLKKAPVVFIQSSQSQGDIPKIKSELAGRQEFIRSTLLKGGRALIVTEYIASGTSIANLLSMLPTLNLSGLFRENRPYDIAALGTTRPANLYFGDPLPKSSRLFTPKTKFYSLPTYQRSDLTGLNREKAAQKKVIKDPQIRKSVVQARADVNTLAQRLLSRITTT